MKIPSIKALIQHVCSKYNLQETEIFSGSRARDLKGLSIADLAKKLQRDAGGLSRLAKNLEMKCKHSPELQLEIKNLKNDLSQLMIFSPK
jgi:ribosomal protein L29